MEARNLEILASQYLKMTDFTRLNVNVLLKKDSIDKYQKTMNFFWDVLTKLNTNIFIIKKIFEFPFELFCSPENRIFFSTVVWNFYENSVLIITKLATDKGEDLHTLLKFKNWVFLQINSKYESDFRQMLREVKFDLGTRKIFNKAKDLRDYVFAHFNRAKLGQIPNLNLAELEKLRDKLNSLFETLSFSIEYVMLPPSYSKRVIHPKGVAPRFDIEVLLDSIAKNSDLLNMPERSPELWKFHKENYDEEGIKIINKYRKKFNLPEV
ncbi:hypothetical protein ACFLRM_03670 [Acidobacteriota bacterium]